MTRPDTSIRAVRDLLLIDAGDPLIVACDSIGGIGPLPADTHPATADDVAHFAARVPLLEVICAGAQPIALLATLSYSHTTAAPLLAEFRRSAADAGIAADAVTFSTEDNVTAQATGVGVVVVGRSQPGLPRPGAARSTDVIVCVGWPRSAPHDRVYRDHPDIVTVSDVRAVLASGLVHDALPVGSRGIAWEVTQLATTASLHHTFTDTALPLTASAGPSTCVLFACPPANVACLDAVISAGTVSHIVAQLT